MTLSAGEGAFGGPTNVVAVRSFFLGKSTPVRLVPVSQRFELSGTRAMSKPIGAIFRFMDLDLPWTTNGKPGLFRLDDNGVWHYVGGVSVTPGYLTAQISEWGVYAVMRVQETNGSTKR
ncbi:hypothetical protein MO973_18210 [Paenibacillus sp. TRM 82003]|nr:hypothetical protein [Paenibacillus sp. TRM 82003]